MIDPLVDLSEVPVEGPALCSLLPWRTDCAGGPYEVPGEDLVFIVPLEQLIVLEDHMRYLARILSLFPWSS